MTLWSAWCAARDGLPIHTLTELTGLHKSTVHRMLAAMASRGYVRKDEDTGRYRMTTRLYALSGQVVENLDLVQVARAPMEHLRDEVARPCTWSCRRGATLSMCTR